MLTVFVILLITVLLFVFTRLRPDLVALLSLLALYLTGVLTASQAVAGFADSTTILIAALFVVGEGLSRTGVTAWLGLWMLRQAGESAVRLLIVLMVGAAVLSAFMSNTGTVAVLLPAAVAAAWRIGSAPSQFLIPLAFAANLGGMLTLIGTPPNIIVADTLAATGAVPFGFFEFALIGLPILVAALIFTALFGRRLLPLRVAGPPPTELGRAVTELAESYALPAATFLLRVRAGSPLIGKTLAESNLGGAYHLSVISVDRVEVGLPGARQPRPLEQRLHALRRDVIASQTERRTVPGPETRIMAQDLLLVTGSEPAVTSAADNLKLGLYVVDPNETTWSELLLSHEIGISEILLTPRSTAMGQTLAENQIAERYGVQVIGIRRNGQPAPLHSTHLEFGDALLVRGRWRDLERLRERGDDFVVVGLPETLARQVVELNRRAVLAVLILLGMVAAMVFSLLPASMAALLAAVAMVLAGCIPMERTYQAIGWQTVVLIAATIPLSTALEVTGGAVFIADLLVNSLGALSPLLLLAGVFVLTAGFSQVMSNSAATILFAPIMVETATAMGIAPQPLLMMVAIGASSAFLTPIASPTNTMVFEPGAYKFSDYARLGLPLLLLAFVLAMLLVPVIWPF